MSREPHFGERQGYEEWSRQIHEMMDQMLRRHFVDFRTPDDSWAPATNVYEAQTAFYVCVDLAAVDEQAIRVECVGPRSVQVSGCRAKPLPADEPGPLAFHLMEIPEGPFRREIELPAAIDVDRVDARHVKGYLWIRLPKSTPSK